MHEREIFKHIEKSPKLLQGPDLLRTLTKVWSAFTKLIRSLLSSYKTAVCPELGKFIPTAQGASFYPSPSFHSTSSQTPKSTSSISSCPEQVLSYSTISLASGYDRETCMNCIKEILSVSLLQSKSQEVVLDLKVGRLVLRNNEYSFITSYKPATHEKRVDHASDREALQLKPESAHPANPNDIGQFASSAKRIKSMPPKPSLIPWPYLPAFYEDSAGKLGKRYNFQDCPSPGELLEEHKKQIAMKKYKKEFQVHEGKQEGIVLANLANNQMAKDKEIRQNRSKALKDLFITGNKSQIESHRVRKEGDLNEKKNEKYDFFPFVYGSKLEEYQGFIKSQLNEEMKEKMRNDRKEFSTKRELTDSYLTSFPVFLKQDKFEPKRRIDDAHVKKTMGQALNRYEQELINIKTQNENEINKKELQNKLTSVIVQQNKAKRDEKLIENKNYLLQQMEDKKIRQIEEKDIDYIAKATSFGPEESPERIQREKDKEAAQKKTVREELVLQMIKKRRELEDEKIKEIQNEEANAFAMIKEWEKEEFKKEIRNQAAKNLNKEVWKKQMEMKILEKEVSK